jgi:hypothetical protein
LFIENELATQNANLRMLIDAILSLQAENLKQNLSSETSKAQGFITFTYKPEEIEAMMHDMQQPIVTNEAGELIGYALASSTTSSQKVKLLAFLVPLFDAISYKGKPLKEQKYYLMGQVCVKAGYRGIGVFDELYQQHKTLFGNTHDCIVTEISVLNTRSLAAHKRVGFQQIHQYKDQDQDWIVVAWDFK